MEARFLGSGVCRLAWVTTSAAEGRLKGGIFTETELLQIGWSISMKW